MSEQKYQCNNNRYSKTNTRTTDKEKWQKSVETYTWTDFAKFALSNLDSNINVSSSSDLRLTAAGLMCRDGLPPLIVERSN